jgi:hypothetical protein
VAILKYPAMNKSASRDGSSKPGSRLAVERRRTICLFVNEHEEARVPGIYTTNMSSGRTALTFTNLRSECETLAETAKELERYAHENQDFADDPALDRLKARLREQLHSVMSLAST